MKKIFLLTCFYLFAGGLYPLYAAYLMNVPRILIQPDGDTLHCFASGDEFYNWLHDANGYTIIQNPSTGYFVYADKQKGELVPTAFVAGRCNPATKGLRPWLKISKETYREKRAAMPNPAKPNSIRDANTNKGHLNNIVIFIRFADDEDFTNSFHAVDRMFNDSSDNYQANSLFDYYRTASYRQLFITSSFYPQPDDDLILSYQDSMPRGYFMPWSITDTIGYIDNDSVHERTLREHEMLARAIAYVENMIPADLNLDYNNDGYVDNVCFVVKGDVGDWNVLLWPHRWSLYTLDVYIHGKRVYDYNFQLADAGYYFSTSVMCHEMFHSLGAPDLYHYDDSTNMDPVGAWDLMCQNQNPPQQMCSYMKLKYGNWIDDNDIIPLTDYGTYTIKPLNSDSADRIAYRIATQNPEEFIIIDFRNKQDPFDSEVPGRGIIFYRVNPLIDGNADYNGIDRLDEVYVYRTNGTVTNSGNSNQAYFRSNIVRHDFSPTTNPFPFLSDGDIVDVHIGNFVNGLDSMKFDYIDTDLDTTGIGNHTSIPYRLYPNPTHRTLTFDAPTQQPRTLQIYSVTGCLIHVQQVNRQATIDVSHYPAGCYFIKILENNYSVTTLKFIKQQ